MPGGRAGAPWRRKTKQGAAYAWMGDARERLKVSAWWGVRRQVDVCVNANVLEQNETPGLGTKMADEATRCCGASRAEPGREETRGRPPGRHEATEATSMR